MSLSVAENGGYLENGDNIDFAGTDLQAEAEALMSRAAELIRMHDDKAAHLRRQQQQIDQQFAVTERLEAERWERARAERVTALRHGLVEEEENRLTAVGQAEAALSVFVSHINEALAAFQREVEIVRELSGGGRLYGFSHREFASRLGGMTAAAMGQIKFGQSAVGGKFGPLPVGNSGIFPADKWAESEQRLNAADISGFLEETK